MRISVLCKILLKKQTNPLMFYSSSLSSDIPTSRKLLLAIFSSDCSNGYKLAATVDQVFNFQRLLGIFYAAEHGKATYSFARNGN